MFLQVIDEVALSHFKSIATSAVQCGGRLPVFGVLFKCVQEYSELESLGAATLSLREALEKYNQEQPHLPMIMFEYTAEHLLRLCRVVKCPRAHALLVGPGGSGKSVLVKLAAFILEQALYSVGLKHQYSVDD